MIKGVVFDMDGLMFDTERMIAENWVEAGRLCGIQIPFELSALAIGIDVNGTRGIFSRELGNEFDFAGVRAVRTRLDKEYVAKHGVPIKPGLIPLLGYLKSAGISAAVATSTERAKAMFYLDSAGVTEYFDAIICGDMISRGKPAPDIYLVAAQELEVSPCCCIAAEDSPAGIRAAAAAGMMPVMVPDLVMPGEDILPLLYAKCSTLFELTELIEHSRQQAAT